MGRFSGEVYKGGRYHCECGYASKRHVVYPLMLEHLVNGHGIHLCSSMMHGDDYLSCAAEGCTGSHKMYMGQEVLDHAREKHGVRVHEH